MATDAVVAGTAGLIALLAPGGGVAAAAVSPGVATGMKRILDRVVRRRHEREAYMLRWAAAAAAIDPEELLRRCEERPGLEELLLFALRAAGDTTMREKLVALALALASGTSEDNKDLQWQSAFVHALNDLAREHLVMLDRFTMTQNQLGLGDGDPAFDSVPEQIGDNQLDMIGKDMPALRSILAVLQRHGLVVNKFVGGGAVLGGGGALGIWQLTDFGKEFHQLLMKIGEVLEGDRSADLGGETT
jgi:hypothetical protein